MLILTFFIYIKIFIYRVEGMSIYIMFNLLTYLLTYLLHAAESFLRS